MLAGWTRISLDGHAVDVFDPPGALPQAVLYLHSLREELASTDPTLTAALARHRLRCAAPAGGWCWWADRVCPEFGAEVTPERFLLDALVPWMSAKWLLGPRAIALTGVEMGGQGAVRLARGFTSST